MSEPANNTAAVCLIVRNEVQDIAEWVLHHLQIGFSAIFAYDNASDDGTWELLGGLAQTLPVFRIAWPAQPGRNMQLDAYTHCLANLRGQIGWLACIDADEFIVNLFGEPIGHLLTRLQSHPQIGINWLMFGSSGLADTAGRLVLESFTQRAPLDFGPNAHIKSIVRPDQVHACINAHSFSSDQPAVDVFGQPILEWQSPGIVEHARLVQGPWRIHHYFTRSAAHWQRRSMRGDNPGLNLVRSDSDFANYDRNEVPDTVALRYVPAIKSAFAQSHRAKMPVVPSNP